MIKVRVFCVYVWVFFLGGGGGADRVERVRQRVREEER